MKGVRLQALLFLLPSLAPQYAGADAALSLNSGTEVPSADASSWSQYVGLSGGVDAYKPVSESTSFFLGAGGGFRYYPTEKGVSSEASLTGDFSHMKDNLVVRNILGFFYDWDMGDESPELLLAPGLSATVNFMNVAVSTGHTLNVRMYPAEDAAYAGDLGISLLLGELFLCKPLIDCQLALSRSSEFDTYIGGVLEYSWYISGPLMIDGDIGLRHVFSPETSNVLSFTESASFLIGKPSSGKQAQLTVTIPATLSFYAGDSEVYFDIQPLASLDLSLFRHGLFTIMAGWVFLKEPPDNSVYSAFTGGASFNLVF